MIDESVKEVGHTYWRTMEDYLYDLMKKLEHWDSSARQLA